MNSTYLPYMGPSDIPDTPGAYSSTIAVPPLRLRRTGVNTFSIAMALQMV